MPPARKLVGDLAGAVEGVRDFEPSARRRANRQLAGGLAPRGARERRSAAARLPGALVLLALIGGGGPAAAQSSINMFGVLDSSLQYLRGDSHGTQTRLHSGAYKSSRIGFRGVEDLGGGWGAGFWIEAGFNSDTGAGSSTNTQNQPGASAGSGGLTFNRRSTISLLGPFGELRAGRDYSPAFLTHAAYDVFGINGVASGGRLTLGLASELLRPRLVTEARVSNSLSYLLPAELGGLYGKLMIAFGENASTALHKNDGDFAGLRVGYKQGAFDASAAYDRTRYQRFGDYEDLNMGASYDFGSFRLMGMVAREQVGRYFNVETGFDAGGKIRHDSLNIGASIPVGSSQIRGSLVSARAKSPRHSNLARGRMASIGYVHHLSKRSVLYGTYSHIRNGRNALLYSYNNGLATLRRGGSTSGTEIGVNHTF